MRWLCLLVGLAELLRSAESGEQPPSRVLFVGESFGGVPAQLNRIASSLRTPVHIESSTQHDCTAYALRPDRTQRNSTTMRLFHDYEWDFIVVQTFSALPTVVQARYQYLRPAVEDIVALKKSAKVVMYLPHAAHDGVQTRCPATPTNSSRCFPKGTLDMLTKPPCSTGGAWRSKVRDFDCMTYSLARGYLSAMEFGADMVAPCGLAWQSVRSSGAMPWGPSRDCVQQIDKEYPRPSPLDGAAELPLLEPSTPDLTDIRLWNHTVGKNGTVWRDTAVGEYLDALVLFTTLFGVSPVGSALPLADWEDENATLPSPLDARNASELQALAGSIVLSHHKVWGSTPPPVLPVNPTHPNPLLLDLEIGVAAGLVLLVMCALMRPLCCPSRPVTPAPRRSSKAAGRQQRRGGQGHTAGRRGGGSGGSSSGAGSGSGMVDPLLPKAQQPQQSQPQSQPQSTRTGGGGGGGGGGIEEEDDLSRGRYQEV